MATSCFCHRPLCLTFPSLRRNRTGIIKDSSPAAAGSEGQNQSIGAQPSWLLSLHTQARCHRLEAHDPNRGAMNIQFNFELSADANLLRPSRICARDHAANPKVSAGSGSAFIKHDDNGDGLIPISVQTREINRMCSFCRTQATKCNPASGISRMKYLSNNLLNCSIKKSLRSEYNFRIRLM